jgi:threonine dehydrogenase-like Zn-dependent dehydrogenase
VGPGVTGLVPGDLVVPTVRRPGGSLYDRIGHYDMTTDDVYFERGINLRHGFLTEHFVDDPEYIVKIPRGLSKVGVLLEPASVIEKGIAQAFEIQRRLRVWRPRRAAVMGAGTVGLLAALALRLRGLEVTSFARTAAPNPYSERLDRIGVRYVSTRETPLGEAAKRYGPFDLVFEATGSGPVAFEAMEHLGRERVTASRRRSGCSAATS